MYSKSDSAKIIDLAKRLYALGVTDKLMEKVRLDINPRVSRLLNSKELFDFRTITFEEFVDLWCTEGFSDKDISELFLVTISEVIAKRRKYGLTRYGWALMYLERFVIQEEKR